MNIESLQYDLELVSLENRRLKEQVKILETGIEKLIKEQTLRVDELKSSHQRQIDYCRQLLTKKDERLNAQEESHKQMLSKQEEHLKEKDERLKSKDLIITLLQSQLAQKSKN